MRRCGICLAAYLTLSGPALAATLKTTDGLALALADNGQVTGLRIGDQDLVVKAGGGFSVTDVAAGTAPLRLTAPLTKTKGLLTQEQTWKDAGLKLSATYVPGGPYLSLSVRVEDLTGGDRAVEVAWDLPLDATGWQWADSIVARREVRDVVVYRTTWDCPAGPGYNQVYPFTSLAQGATGLSAAVGLGQGPRVHTIEYDHTTKALRLRFHFGLSRRVTQMPGKAWCSFLLYRHDGTWGLRSAAERYYRFFPADFEKRVPYEGYLGYADLETRNTRKGPEALYGIPALGDFGRGFRWLWHQHTAYSALRYETEDRAPPDDATVRRLLDELAAAQGDKLQYRWNWGEFDLLGKPRKVTWEEPAWSLRRRVYEDAEGKITWVGDSRYEEATGPFAPGWMLNFQVTEDPDISPAVKDSLTLAIADWERDNPDREPYTWCVSCDGTGFAGRQLDFRPEHIAGSAAPLTYDRATRRVAVADVSWEWNAKVLGPLSRKHGFLLHRNFVCGTPYVGANLPFVDIGLIECQHGGYGMEELSDLYVRTVGYRRIFRYWFYPAVGPKRDESIRRMFHRGLVYAIYPHLVPEPERYRDLYQRFVPVIEQLSGAGWQPITLATPADPNLRVERYGSVAAASLAFAFRNAGAQSLRTRVTLDPRLGLPVKPGELVVRDLLNGATVAPVIAKDRISLPVALAPGESTAYSVLPRGKLLQADLREAADLLRQAAPLDCTEEANYQSSRPAQFIQDASPKAARPERVLCDGWVAYQGLVWQAGEPVDLTLDLNSPHRLQSVQVHYGWGDAYAGSTCAIEGRDREGNWQPLGQLAAVANEDPSHAARITFADAAEYQFIRLRYPALEKALWLQEVEVTGLDGALVRAADRFDLLAAAPAAGDFGLVSQLALALRVRRMLGHDKTLQERSLQALTNFAALASGVEARLDLPQPPLAGLATRAWLVVNNRSKETFREASLKLRLPPGWRAAPSKFDLTVPAGQTMRRPLDLFGTPGPASLAVLVTGMVGSDPIFLNPSQTVMVEMPLSASLDSPFLPLVTGERELHVSLRSRAGKAIPVTVALQTPEGAVLGQPHEVEAAARADTPLRLAYPVPAEAKAGPISLQLQVRYGDTEGLLPLEARLTAQHGSCPRSPEPPRVDGDLADTVWQAAPELAGLLQADGRPPTQATTARLLWDDQSLYLAVHCAEDRLDQVKAALTGRDAPVWQDDDVAVMLNCGGVYHKLEVTPTGTIFDAREGDAAWNGDWKVSTARAADGWTVEAAIPWASLGWKPAAGLALGVNLIRQEKPHGEVSYWVPGNANDGWNVGAVALGD